MPNFKKSTGFKMKGSSFYGKNGKSPIKQLAPKYMRTPEEEAFYKSPEGRNYEPVPMGTYRSPGAVSRYVGEDEKFDWDTNTNPKKKGDTVTHGVPSGPKKTMMGPTISQEEYDKRYQELPERPSWDDADYEAKDEARTAAYKKLSNAKRGTEVKKKKKK